MTSNSKPKAPRNGGSTSSGAGTGGANADAPPADTIFTGPPPEGHAKTTSAVLGEIVWLMSQSPLHKQFFISDLEWFVMTPVLLKQFRLFYGKPAEGQSERPIGVVFWGEVSEEVAARLAAGTSKLRPQDWKSGPALWVVEVIAPFGGAEQMVADLKARVFPERPLRYLAVGPQGKEVKVA